MSAMTYARKAHAPSAPALKIGPQNDAFEREADRTADEVMSSAGRAAQWSFSRMSIAPPLQRKCSCGGGKQDECEECKAKKQVQRSATGTGPASAPASVENVLQFSGTPLDRTTRSFFESRFGHDFSKVRIHTGVAAASSARDVAAKAYTVGDRIVFDTGQYAPHTQHGRKLLAHELTHVVQQGGATASAGPLVVGRSNDAFEHEAHRMAGTEGQKSHFAPERQMPVRRRSSRAVQRFEAGEHAQFGAAGDELKALAPKAFKYTVKPGEVPKKIAQKFGITEDELKEANKDKWRKWQLTKDPASKTEGFNAGDEIMIPPVLNESIKDALKVKELSLVVNGVTLDYGEGMAMGDFYETPEQMMAAPAAELQELSKQIKNEKATGKVDDDKLDKITGGRYTDLALKNVSHFSPSNPAIAPVSGKSTSDNKSEWEKNHTKALLKSSAGDKDQALTINSFADHFLTDAFAAGHLINKTDVMEIFKGKLPMNAKGNFEGASEAFFNAVANGSFPGKVQGVFSPLRTVACFSWWGDHPEKPCSEKTTTQVQIDSAKNFSKLLQGIQKEQPERFGSAVAKGIHDNLNQSGVEVENNKGDKWTIPGDKTLKSVGEKGGDNKTLEIGRKAVAQSQMNVFEVFKQAMALDLPALFKKVWDFVPHATGASEKRIQSAVTAGTDPASATLISDAVKLITDNCDMIARKLVDMGKLYRPAK